MLNRYSCVVQAPKLVTAAAAYARSLPSLPTAANSRSGPGGRADAATRPVADR